MGSHKSKSSKRKSSEILRSKKSRKSKKKPSRRHRSISSCSDDDSVSSISSYSSSSEEDYRSRKGGRSRSRADVKSKKKRSERRVSSNRESKEDSAPSRKKKRSKRKRNTEHKEKHQKKRRRDLSISSATSDSLSCSSCESEPSESEEVELESRSRNKIRDKINPDKHKIEAKESRTKSAISLSAEDQSDFNSVFQKGEEHVSLNHGRRIKSVITVVEHPQQEENEENNLSQNNEAEDKLECRSGIVSDKSSLVKKMMVKEDCVINDVISGHRSSGKRVSNLSINQDEMKSLEGESEKEGRVIDSVVSVNATSSGSNDLELILRQKALENLRKFRGKVQAESPVTVCQKVNQLSLSKPVKLGNMLAEQEGSKDVKVISVAGQNSKSGSSKEILHPKIVERENVTDEYKKLEPEVTKPSHIQKCDDYALSKNISRDDHSKAFASHDESKTDVAEIHSTMERAFSHKNPSDGNDSASHTLPEINNATSSAMVGPTSGIRTLEEHSSKDLAEVKDGGQFQQKTMSVMRSGEVVQVYNVLSISDSSFSKFRSCLDSNAISV
ncbi:unnamed protein product [Cuscuta epithymum]|uniref:Uncharacterized protein n=1 Tax=Cuscuta epithymum TaxID=186058 RepID=A0AAV0DMG7_9ASTE|nr:unnamed protein product [Cuscuta epithymum]